jgi:hypothetical protein
VHAKSVGTFFRHSISERDLATSNGVTYYYHSDEGFGKMRCRACVFAHAIDGAVSTNGDIWDAPLRHPIELTARAGATGLDSADVKEDLSKNWLIG